MRKLAAILTALALVLPATAAAKAHASRRHQSSPVQVRHQAKAHKADAADDAQEARE